MKSQLVCHLFQNRCLLFWKFISVACRGTIPANHCHLVAGPRTGRIIISHSVVTVDCLTLIENEDCIMVSSSESSSESPNSSASCHSTLRPRWKRRWVPECQHNRAAWWMSCCVKNCQENEGTWCNAAAWTPELRTALWMSVRLVSPVKGPDVGLLLEHFRNTSVLFWAS